MTKQTINVGTSPNDNRGDSLRASFQKINANFTELYTALGINADVNLNLGAFEFAGSVLSTTDSSAIVIDQAVTVSSNLTVGGDVLPSVANGGDLGSSARPWKSLYISSSTIYIGTTSLSVDSQGNLLVGGQAVADVGTATWNSITGKPTFATVATSGAYSDLSGRPTIPTLTSQLTNDSNFITTAVLGNGLDVDIKGSVFGDDSSLLVDAVDNKIYATELTVAVGNFVNVNSNNVDVENINGLASQINFTVGGNNNLVIENNLVTIQNVSLSVAGDITLGGNIRSEGNINIDINLSDSTLRRWQFGEDGNLTLPQGGNISEGGGFSGAIKLTPAGGANEYQALLIYPTAGEGDHIHLTAGGGTTELYLGDDLHYVKLESDGNIRIQADNGVNGAAWTFGTDGDLTIPGDIRSEGNINIDINLGDSTLRRWQFGEDGILTLPSVGKISNGAYDWTFGSTGITTFPGAIKAGNINNLVVNDLGGPTLTVGSQLQIGNSANAGAGVLIKNAVTNTLGSETSLESGSKIQMDNGNVSLFGYTYNGLGGGDGLENQLVVEVDNSNLNKVVRIGTRIINTIEGSTTNVFQGVTIGQYGELTFPDATVQSTAWTGIANALRSEGNINIEINLSDSTLRRWQFGEDGNLTLPQGGNISEGGGISGAIKLTPSGGANEYQALLIYPTGFAEGDHLHLTAGGGSTELYLGSDNHYVKLANDGFVIIKADDGVNSAVWGFSPDGTTSIPGDIKSNSNINIEINLSDSTLRRWQFGEDGILTFPDGTSQSTAYQVTKSITHTSNLLAGPSSFGQGSSIAITDNYQTERVSITNSLGGIARATLANITVIGKIVILTSTSPHETFVDRYGWSGATQSYVTVSNSGNGVVILMSLGSNGWKLISTNE